MALIVPVLILFSTSACLAFWDSASSAADKLDNLTSVLCFLAVVANNNHDSSVPGVCEANGSFKFMSNSQVQQRIPASSQVNSFVGS